MADQLKPESLKWALTHVSRFGDTDLFPVPFEYSAIEYDWDNLQDELVNINLATYEPHPLRRFLVPKPRGGYRVAIQLDPIDTLIYTALVYEAADLIEQQRISLERKIVCSYRIELDAKGQFFRSNNGWPDFYEKRKELADSGKYDYVLMADIADFYNQIGHHRVRNALEIVGVSSVRAKNLELFLMNLTALQSRGIPVGPSASILLSEACLNDVDTFLLRKGYVYTRYSDDFRIFCINRSEAYRALHDLSDYLYTSHRLTLQSSKTDIVPIADYIKSDLLDPEKLEKQRRTEKVNEILQEIWRYVAIHYDELTEDSQEEIVKTFAEPQELKIIRENLVELFDTSLVKPSLNLGLVRYLLRRATTLQTGVLQRRVLKNLDYLAPVMRDVAKYLTKIARARNATEIGNNLIQFVESSDIAFTPYVRLWITDIFLEKLTAKFKDTIYDFFESTQDQLGIRPTALLAREMNLLDWVRERKEIWNNQTPWDRRAVIWTASVLPQDERSFWLKRVQSSGDLLDKVVAKAVRGGIMHTTRKKKR